LDLDVGLIYTYERQFMTPLVSTLANSGPGLNMRLVLVDNASTDGVAEWSATFAKTKVVRNQRRLGYAANLNRVLEVARARYVLLLNTDMLFDPPAGCLARMVRFMDEHADCGVSTCRIYHPDGAYGYPARRFQTLRAISARRLGLERVFGPSLREYLYQDKSIHDSFACDWVSGCFMLVRRQAIEEVGLFDPTFRKYFEDVDLCARMAQGGWRVMFHGETYCYHYEQRASKRLFSPDAWHHLRSYVRWIRKYGLTPPRHLADDQPLGRAA